MTHSSIESLKIKAKLLQKAKSKKGNTITLKEAFSIIAKVAGYTTWKEMKDEYKKSDILNPPRWSSQWKTWFALKEEAYECFKATDDGYLIPYRNQFFVCDSNYISSLGISNEDPDLLNVGRDWTSPKDKDSWEKLIQKIKESHEKPR